MSSSMKSWMIRLGLKYAAVVMGVVLLTITAARYGQSIAYKAYTVELETVKAEMAAEQAALKAMPLSAEGKRIEQAHAIAKVLYGIKDNSTDDLRTACWCIFNRVDSEQFPDTIEEVVAQPQQWMQYDPSNPILESLYEIARAELDSYLDGERRPCDKGYVFMSWSPEDVSLRNEFMTTPATRYWRIK